MNKFYKVKFDPNKSYTIKICSLEKKYNYYQKNYSRLCIENYKLKKENAELKEENTILEGNKIGLKLAIQELKEENKKISKAADKMYEYISYYGWEDFESNTGCNREEMVDYFYKE